MGVLFEHKPVKLIISIIYKETSLREKAEKQLKKLYGEFELLEKVTTFDLTDYYYDEMGQPLERKLICFKKLIKIEKMYNVKIRTNKIENSLAEERHRTVNIDPGYITEAKLVLLTTKNYTHRIYIGGHIFAESTLFYMDGKFNIWPWTYPDYASTEMIEYFEKVREIYMKDIGVRSKG
jgi:uncharacterized protein DUF4416